MWPQLAVPGTTWTLSTYALVRVAYFVVALVLVLHLAARQGIAQRIMLRAFALGVPIGLLGAWGLDILEYWSRYQAAGLARGRDGSSIYGALLAIGAFVAAYGRIHGIPFLRLADLGAVAMALGEALTRVGCFAHGCCYGTTTGAPWGVRFPPESFAFQDQVARGVLIPPVAHTLPVHPVQLYSTALMLTVTLALYGWLRRAPRPGRVFSTFLIAYGLLRLGLAPLRVEALPSMKIFSIAFITAGTVGLAYTGRERA